MALGASLSISVFSQEAAALGGGTVETEIFYDSFGRPGQPSTEETRTFDPSTSKPIIMQVEIESGFC